MVNTGVMSLKSRSQISGNGTFAEHGWSSENADIHIVTSMNLEREHSNWILSDVTVIMEPLILLPNWGQNGQTSPQIGCQVVSCQRF